MDVEFIIDAFRNGLACILGLSENPLKYYIGRIREKDDADALAGDWDQVGMYFKMYMSVPSSQTPSRHKPPCIHSPTDHPEGRMFLW